MCLHPAATVIVAVSRPLFFPIPSLPLALIYSSSILSELPSCQLLIVARKVTCLQKHLHSSCSSYLCVGKKVLAVGGLEGSAHQVAVIGSCSPSAQDCEKWCLEGAWVQKRKNEKSNTQKKTAQFCLFIFFTYLCFYPGPDKRENTVRLLVLVNLHFFS